MLYLVLLMIFVAAGAAFMLVYVPMKQSIDQAQARAERAVSAELEEMFLFIPVDKLGYAKLACMAMAGFVGYLIFGNAKPPAPYVAAGFMACLGYFGPELTVRILRTKRRKAFAEQLVDGLVMMGNGLRAGFTLQQAMELLVNETKPPISQEFGLLLREVRVGVDLDQAMLNMCRRTKDQDLELAVTAVMITRQVGGNLPEIFERICAMIRDRKTIEGKADALTAQGKLQALIVASMPYILLMVISKINPEMMALLWTTLPGFLAIGLMVILDTAGYFWVLKLTKIEY